MDNGTKIYCLFCLSGQENKIIDRLKQYGYQTLAPTVMRWKKDENGTKKSICRLLPGYVFFETAEEPDW